MKIVGIVLLSLLGLIVFLLALVMLVPVGVMAGYREKVFSLKIKFLFLRFTILPQKEKKKKKKKRPKKEKKKKEPKEKPAEPEKKDKKKKKKKKTKLSLGLIKTLLTKHLPPILSCFYISTLNLKWDVHAPDAGDTAIRYGAASSAVAGFLAILDRFSKRLRHANVDIVPNYDEGRIEGDVTVSITVGKLVFSAIRLLIDLIKYKVL